MPMDVLPTGAVLEKRYRILRLLGQGGMSRVYLAEDTCLNVRVAVVLEGTGRILPADLLAPMACSQR